MTDQLFDESKEILQTPTEVITAVEQWLLNTVGGLVSICDLLTASTKYLEPLKMLPVLIEACTDKFLFHS